MTAGEPGAPRQAAHADRDAFTAGRDIYVTPPAAERTGRGVLWPPLGRLPHHVRGRDLLVERLTALASTPDGRAHVLTGLGGMGKSTVALSIAASSIAAGRPVWWVAATDEAALTSGLLGLATELGADRSAVEAAQSGRADPSDVLWGRLESCTGWVLVIDNADDLRSLETAGRRVADGNGWVRGSRSGLVVVTSRDGDMRHWGRTVELHSVGWLNDEDGTSVLLDLAPRAGTREEAEALSERLGGLALALHHAGSQLASPFARERSFAGYLRAWQHEVPALVGGDNDREVVTRTWELSLNQLADAGVPQARPLLEVLAWFAAAVPIPVSGLNERVLGQICGGRAVSEGLEALLSVGLVETRLAKGAPADTVIVHPLVAETTRHRLTAAPGPVSAASAAVEVLAAVADDLETENPADWPVWAAWVPHLSELLARAAPLLAIVPLAGLVRSVARMSWALDWAGAFSASLAITRTALDCTGRIDPGHPAVLKLRFQEADALFLLGNYSEAERKARALLYDQQRALGADHPDTLTTKHADRPSRYVPGPTRGSRGPVPTTSPSRKACSRQRRPHHPGYSTRDRPGRCEPGPTRGGRGPVPTAPPNLGADARRRPSQRPGYSI